MRKIIAITQLTLDGVMQGPGGPEEDPRNGFSLGGWAMPFGDEALSRIIDETMAGAFDLLLGRRTYQIFAGYWPHQQGTIATAFNRATKYVATGTLSELSWTPSVRLDGDAVRGIRRLKESAGPELHLWGSGVLLQALMAAGLVDEHRLWIVPVVLGRGTRLFGEGLPAHRFTLIDSRSTPPGILVNTYRPAGALAQG